MRRRRSPILILALTLAAASCGKNVYQASEPKDAAEDATLKLERNDPSGAIDILTAALDKDPGNVQLLSILSLAYAQRANLDPLSFALNLSQAQSSGSSVPTGGAPTAGNFGALFAILPPATVQNVSDIQSAVTTITQIPADQRQQYDTFKFALFQTASMLLSMKALDTNNDGYVSPQEILAGLTATVATDLLGQLTSAASALGVNPSDKQSQQLQQAITKYQSQIQAAAPGGTAQQQLAAFISGNPSLGTATSIGTSTALGLSTEP